MCRCAGAIAAPHSSQRSSAASRSTVERLASCCSRVVVVMDASARGRPCRPRAGSAPAAPRPRRRSPSTSGAALWIDSSTASLSVTAEDGQPLQLPCSCSRTTPSSTPSSSTLPPCVSRYGRTSSSAPRTRASSGTGCSPCSSSRWATSSSSPSAAASSPSSALGDVGRRSARAPRRRGRAAPARAPARSRARPRRGAARPARAAPRRATSVATALIRARRTSVSAPGAASCPCRGTCARRTAGTGRTSGPRA